jgi:hypothetical protein
MIAGKWAEQGMRPGSWNPPVPQSMGAGMFAISSLDEVPKAAYLSATTDAG